MSNQEYSANLGLDLVPLTKDPENAGDIYRLYNACKLIMSCLDQYTGILGASTDQWATMKADFITTQNTSRFYGQASVAIAAGQICGINAAGKLTLALAGAVVGWAPFSIALDAFGEIRLIGVHKAVSGLTPGVNYYASTATPGAITSTVTTQKLGVALTADRLFFRPN